MNLPSPEDVPVGVTEIANRLGVERQSAQNWITRGVLPSPRWTVGGRPAWSWQHDILPWVAATGRTHMLTPHLPQEHQP